MYAAISTWTLDRELTEPQAIVALRDLVDANLASALAAGMLDAIVLYLQPDCIVGIAIYASLTEAFAAGPRARAQVTARCGTTLQRENRVVGRLYHSLLPDEAELAWRAEASAMYATWATWHVGEHLRTDEALERYIAEGYRQIEPLLRRLGLIDGLVIRYADDAIAVLNLYAEPVQGQAGYQDAVTALADYTAGHVKQIETRTGRAFDLSLLLARPSHGGHSSALS